MSVRVMADAWGVTLPPVQKLVLLKLADCANDEGRNAFPAVATIAADCGISDRTVQRTLRELEAAGRIAVERPSADHRPRCYALVIERGDKLTGRHSRQTGVTFTTYRGDTAMSPDPSVDPSVDPSINKTTRARAKTPTPRTSETAVTKATNEPPDEAFVLQAVTRYGQALGGAAEVRAEIDAALNHVASLKAIDQRRYLWTWLRRAAEWRKRDAVRGPARGDRGASGGGGFAYGDALAERIERERIERERVRASS